MLLEELDTANGSLWETTGVVKHASEITGRDSHDLTNVDEETGAIAFLGARSLRTTLGLVEWIAKLLVAGRALGTFTSLAWRIFGTILWNRFSRLGVALEQEVQRCRTDIRGREALI